ncbi:hypothetical protein IW261DRAFT_1484497 [Armillaria novae-zelandiae]|uniref:C2H2-type domain-containing protein n=1 Tax=Armillaria novae-zelandiae TaxID=153914 RepID=A0AA39P5W9_9AGAR|nr:hypothetical protein IW261DRAFT_1484497 [Armillaria novae-zelandiae]
MPAVRQKKKASGNKGEWNCPFPECKISSKTKSGLDVHLNAVHFRVKPYHCTDGFTKKGKLCAYSSSDPGNFNRHRKRHHGYVPRSSPRKKKGTSSKGPEVALESNTDSVSQPKPATSPSTATLDALPQYIDARLEADGYYQPYFAGARNLRGDAHYDEEEFIPATRSIYSLQHQLPQQPPVHTLFNAQPANFPSPLVGISQEEAPYAEHSPGIETLRIAMNYMNLHRSLNVGLGMDSTTLADGLQSIYPASLAARQEYTGAYGVETVSLSTLLLTRTWRWIRLFIL